MGTKGVPFGYLEFLRAIRGKPYPHMRAPPLAAVAGRRRRWCRTRVRVRVLYPVQFFLNRVSRVSVTRSMPAPPSESEPPSATTVSQPSRTVGRLLRLKRTVATVQTEPLQLFSWVRTLLPLPERYK